MRVRTTKRVLMVVENCPYLQDPRVRKEAEALVSAGYRISVICPGRSGEPWHEQLGNVGLYRFSQWPSANNSVGYVMEYTWAMLSIALLSVLIWLREGFEIIHVANPPDVIVPILSVYKLLGKLIIYDQHDICPELYAAKFGHNPYLYKMLLLLERYSYRLADHVIVTNESYKESALQRGRLPESKVTVVRNGPSLPNLGTANVNPELRAKARNIIAFAGVTGFQDGLDYLCRSLHYLRYELHQENFYCIVMGDGDALEEIKALARDFRLDDKIWFAGWISDPDLYAGYISTADICVAPDPSNSYNDRSTFVKIMEYMAARKPIVAFDLPETRRSARTAASYARPNEVASFAERLADLMTVPSLRRSMGEVGYMRVRDGLAWQYSVPKLLEVYAKVAKSSGEDATVTPSNQQAEEEDCVVPTV